jgi:cytochrome c peroxidase
LRLALTFLLALVTALAQGNSYNASHLWWEPNQDEFFPWDSDYENPTGLLRVSLPNGSFRTGGHPFFKPLGANGRACITCHQPSNAMSLSVDNIRRRWTDTAGQDPLFAAIDGSNCPSLPQAQRASHSLLLDHGLFRVSLPWPPRNITPDFRLEVLSDPPGCNATPGQISVYRRPRPSANLTRLTPGPHGAVLMADGRAPSLRDQAIDAILVHQQASSAPSESDLKRILDFETTILASQYSDYRGGITAQFDSPGPGSSGAHRASALRGKALFDARCSSCHQSGTPRAHAIPKPHLPALPTFRATCASGKVLTIQDPGLALITGKCADLGAIVIPQFFGLAARPPYFSNGSAPTLEALLESYQQIGIRFSPAEKQDLLHFLLTL